MPEAFPAVGVEPPSRGRTSTISNDAGTPRAFPAATAAPVARKSDDPAETVAPSPTATGLSGPAVDVGAGAAARPNRTSPAVAVSASDPDST